MDDGPYRSILLYIIFILASSYFAATEIAFTSVSRIRLMSRADDGDRRAKKALNILDHFEKALSTILIGNNIMHIGAATLATLIVARTWGNAAVTASTFVTTFILFLIGEMLPKAFAKDMSEEFSLAAAGSLIFLMRLLTPISFAFTALSRFLSRRFKKDAEEPTYTEDELQDIIDNVVEDGALDEGEGELVQSAFEFADTTAKDILTPWEKTTRLRVNTTYDEMVEFIRKDRHSRVPVTDRSDRPIGVLITRKFLIASRNGEDTRLRTLMTPAHYIRANMPIDELLPDMSNARAHMSIVVDDTGHVLGIVTVEDVLEELVGEIYDEKDAERGAAQ